VPVYDDIAELTALRKELCRALSRCVEPYGISTREAYKRLTDIPKNFFSPTIFQQERSHAGRGRPREISYYLALYLIFVFKDILGGELPFSRPNSGGAPHGPAFEAVIAALAVAQWRLQQRVAVPLGYRLGRPAVANLIEGMRTSAFKDQMNRHRLTQDPAYFIGQAASIAYMVQLARKSGVEAARARKKKGASAD
jgi:hypothetical protein